MSRLSRTALVSLLAIGVMAVPMALGSSVHLKGGSHAEPQFTDNGLTLTGSGALSGLGNGDVLVTLTATANPTATCGNPGSNTWQAPGQNPAEITVSGTVSIPDSEIKNGNTPFTVTTDPPTTPVPGAPDCPNPSWTEIIVDLAFTSGTITVEQPVGTLVLTVSCTISPPSSDGPVPNADVSCSSA